MNIGLEDKTQENSKGDWSEWIPIYGLARYYRRLIKENRTNYHNQSSDEERQEWLNKSKFHGSTPFVAGSVYIVYALIRDFLNNQ